MVIYLHFLLPAQRYDNFKLISRHVMAKLNMTYLPSLKNCCRPHCRCHHLGYLLRALFTSLYHLVPKYLRATWTKPEQSHLLPEACFPNGTDNRRQRQRRMKRPPPEPSDILKRFYALYDNKLSYYMKKVSKLYYLLNPILHTVINW